MEAPVTVMETAGEGGAWGSPFSSVPSPPEQSLAAFLADQVFKNDHGVTLAPTEADIQGFTVFTQRY